MTTLKKSLLATAMMLPMAGTAMAEGQVNIYAWSESISPELIEKFTEETGIEVTVDSYSSNEDALTRLQAGSSGYDVITPSQHFVKIMIDEGLLMDIDANEMSAYDQLDEEWKGQWWDPENDYSIPMAYGTAGFAVNRDIYDGPVDSWSVLFEPTELAGKIAMLSYPDEVVSAAQLYLGVEYCTEETSEMRKVYELLDAQKSGVVAYTSDNIANRLGSGEVAAHFWWDGQVLRNRLDGANIEFAMPKEGLVGWLDSYVVPAGAENVDEAKAFINFMSEVDNATAQANYYAHSVPVEINEEESLYTPENAPELFPTVPVVFAQACSPAAQDLVTRVWTDLLQ
ncbi:extracellular solute-binding protein [Pseudooceanicola marinus]|uniref:extracellular solute-binding protein n=1 Tax=Pseudooceanicola marinus TaxID=396013 RepID=UPI001C987D18|nr:extracellular solute-binding protein [Pseudooceanicola marinus]MBY5974787.1 extracellular solute-binding protein [Ferrimonas balearica]MCA1338051.1 extracellular solute-binding protein [Pseudooceanicola marinus]